MNVPIKWVMDASIMIADRVWQTSANALQASGPLSGSIEDLDGTTEEIAETGSTSV